LAHTVAGEIPPATKSDVNDTAGKPESLKKITRSAIPDSDDEEDDVLPEAPGLDGDVQQLASNSASDPEGRLPTATLPTIADDRLPKTSEISSSASNLGIEGQGQEAEAAASASFKGATHELQAFAIKETFSPAAPASTPTPKGNGIIVPSAPVGHPTQRQSATVFPSSLQQTEATKNPPERWSQEAAASVHSSDKHQEEATRFTDSASSPLQASNYSSSSFEAKVQKSPSPSPSFTAPEASQNRDVLMAELKAMQIVGQISSFA
jgi:hypothetical protein